MQIMYKFSKTELSNDVALIAETYRLGSKPTETGRGKRLFRKFVPESEDEIARKIISTCKRGITTDILFTEQEWEVFKKVVNYCVAL